MRVRPGFEIPRKPVRYNEVSAKLFSFFVRTTL